MREETGPRRAGSTSFHVGWVLLIVGPGGGVRFDVEPDAFHLPRVTDNAVVVVAVPDRHAGSRTERIDVAGHRGLETGHDRA